MTRDEIRKEIRETKTEMRERGIKRTSCFNGGLSHDERSYNTILFALETEIAKLPR